MLHHQIASNSASEPIVAPGLIQEVGFSFVKEISQVVQAHNIPPKLIIDQASLPFVLLDKYTMNKKMVKVTCRPLALVTTGIYRERFR